MICIEVMFVRSLHILKSGWYFLILPLVFELVFTPVLFILPYELIHKYQIFLYLYSFVAFLVSSTSWAFLAFFAHKKILNPPISTMLDLKSNFLKFLIAYLVISSLITAPQLIHSNWDLTLQYEYPSKLFILMMALAMLVLSSIIALIVLSVIGIVLPAIVANQKDKLWLIRKQGIKSYFKTGWHLILFPGVVSFFVTIAYWVAWGLAGETLPRGLLSALIQQEHILISLLRHVLHGFIIILTASVLCDRYTEIRESKA